MREQKDIKDKFAIFHQVMGNSKLFYQLSNYDKDFYKSHCKRYIVCLNYKGIIYWRDYRDRDPIASKTEEIIEKLPAEIQTFVLFNPIFF